MKYLKTLVILSESEVSINQSANLHFKSMDFFAAATPCNPLGRYAQNDKVAVIVK